MRRSLKPRNADRYRVPLPIPQAGEEAREVKCCICGQRLTKRRSAAEQPKQNARGEFMPWEDIKGWIAVIGFIGTIIAYASKQSIVLTKLETTLKALNSTLEELKENNRESHKDIYNKLAVHDKEITELKGFHRKQS